ncbi:Hsp20/alpha crystallin family protein [Candidatus Sumerlaeota bacterium]|nr:Hsp20/alpha crystallin family protein [Candidatus Sumerlaeota bacterium]
MAEDTVARPVEANEPTTQESTHEPERYISPAVDIYENEASGLVVLADMPGLTNEAVSLSVEKDVLTIKGVARESVELPWVYREFTPVGYFRQFTLGKKIDQGAIKAEYKHGVLRVTLPFAEEVKPRQIEVKVA